MQLIRCNCFQIHFEWTRTTASTVTEFPPSCQGAVLSIKQYCSLNPACELCCMLLMLVMVPTGTIIYICKLI